MEFLRKLRWFFYPSAFLLVFLFASYCTFPTKVLKDLVKTSVTQAAIVLAPRAKDLPEVSMTDASLWRLSGVNVKDLKVQWQSNNTEQPIAILLNSIRGRLSVFALLFGQKSISLKADMYGGDLDSHFKIRSNGTLGSLRMASERVDLKKMDFLPMVLGAQLEGVIDLMIDLNANSQLNKDGTGGISLKLDGMAYGPGSINLPGGGFMSSLTVPRILLGQMVADLSLDKGKVESKTIKLEGGDLEADVKLSIDLGRNPMVSRINGDGWFSIKPEFINANETLKMLYDLMPELKKAQQGNGKVGFSLRGSLARPYFKLEDYVGMNMNKNKKPTLAHGD